MSALPAYMNFYRLRFTRDDGVEREVVCYSTMFDPRSGVLGANVAAIDNSGRVALGERLFGIQPDSLISIDAFTGTSEEAQELNRRYLTSGAPPETQASRRRAGRSRSPAAQEVPVRHQTYLLTLENGTEARVRVEDLYGNPPSHAIVTRFDLPEMPTVALSLNAGSWEALRS